MQQAGFDDEPLEVVRSFEDLRWRLTQGALNGRNVRLLVSQDQVNRQAADVPVQEVLLKLGELNASDADAQLFRKIGILSPWTQPVIGEVTAGGAAAQAGLRSGDVVRRVGGLPIVDGQQLRDAIRGSVQTAGSPRSLAPQNWQVVRAGQTISLQVTPQIRQDGNVSVGRIGAYVGAPPQFITVRYGVFDGLWQGTVRTWEVSLLTLKMMGKMVTGQSSLKNLSGPLTIADYAGKSASLGWSSYLLFLALISVSLGVLNLLPLPVLDGGHLMYYLWEAITGRTVSVAWMETLQRGGMVVLLGMMSLALFNDVTRLFG